MIKQGSICVYDNKYNYLYDLEESSWFGEYNIMFGVYSSLNYKGKSITKSIGKHKVAKSFRNVLFKIPSYNFMKIVTTDVQAFKHFHEMSLQKFRFNNKMQEQFNVLKQKQRE